MNRRNQLPDPDLNRREVSQAEYQQQYLALLAEVQKRNPEIHAPDAHFYLSNEGKHVSRYFVQGSPLPMIEYMPGAKAYYILER